MASEEDPPQTSPIPSPIHDEEYTCPLCEEKLSQPKILSCLHVFCQKCIEKQLEEQEENENEDGDTSSPIPNPVKILECTSCKQETRLPPKGVDALPSDHVVSDLLDMSSIEDMQIVCTSCKAKEKATARCTDCANFLCPNCVTAHQFMRCFENHKVVSFDDLKKGEGLIIHKPIFCNAHPTENMKYYCVTCQTPVCNDCMVGDHRQPDHFCEKLSDIEPKTVEEIRTLISESRNKAEIGQQATATLDSTLSELQMQRDNAKSYIQETFQSYKAILEKKQDELLQEMEEQHSAQELAVMEMCHNVASTTEKIEDGCTFAERLLKHGEPVHIMLGKKMIVKQLCSLINNTPKLDVTVNIEFKTDLQAFEDAVGRTFGYLVKDDPKIDPQLSPLHSSFDSEPFPLPPGVLDPESVGMVPTTPAEFIPQLPSMTPVSINGNLPPHMSSLQQNFNQPQPTIGTPIMGAVHPIGMVEAVSRNSQSPAMSDSGISVDAASTNSNNSATMFNVAAMAKLSSVPFSSQGDTGLAGQVGLNGQMSGLSINCSSGTSSAPSSRTQTPLSQAETSLTNILNPSSRNQNSNLETLASLMNQQPPPQLNGMGALGNLGSLGSIGNSLGNMGNLDSIIGQSSGLPSPGASSTFSSGSSTPYPPVRRNNKMSAMQIRCKFGQLGPGKGQFNSPHGFCLGIEEDIIVADTNNHRVQVFEKTGEFKYQFGIPGREEGQLWYPRKVAVMRTSGKFVVCDRGNERSRMQIFTKNGHFIKKIAIRYIDIVAGLAITPQGHIVAVDSVSPTVFCISESGDLIKWFDCSDYMREPSDIAISGREYFVCDFKGHCVVVFSEDGQFLRRIGCENITNYPNGIDISDAGDVLVGDSHGNRFHVGVFQRDGSLIGEFQCPYVKVSRCCGLKITAEGYVVTLAKNNHHVLVLNTLYIT